MKNYFEFDQDDKKLWLGIGVASAIFIILFSLVWGGLFQQIERVVFALIVIFLPGYIILKLYLDKLSISDNRVTDKIMASLGLSIACMVVPYYLTTYLRPYVFNTDEEGWGTLSNTWVVILLLILVVVVAFGVKYYQNKKNGLA
ncbi:MAG: hypothetical protein PHE55_18140 [Methylococcaceae bacterium]|nr:hypothetical protein [Methylococcaceae bacterium]